MAIQEKQLKAAFQIESASPNGSGINVNWKDGHQSLYHNLWLRDACRCPVCFQYDTLSVNDGNDPLTMPLEPVCKGTYVDDNGHLEIKWADEDGEHQSLFEPSWLRAHCQSELGMTPERMLWDGSLTITHFDYDEMVNNDDVLFECLDTLYRVGATIIDNAPKDEDHFRKLIDRVGFLHTRYHPTNVFTLDTTDKVAQKIQHAYKLGRLFYHTDLTAYTDSGVIQFLHCLEYKNAEWEGEAYSIITDGFKIADVLKQEYPEYYAQLSQAYAPACRRRMIAEESPEEGQSGIGKYAWESYRTNHVIDLDEWGNVREIRFNHNTRAPFDMPHDKIPAFYEAYRKFIALLEDPQYTKEFLISPGQVFICNNARILHGRTEVGTSLQRKVLGAYVKGESFKSRWRLLMGQKTGMSDFWLTGCSDHALDMLANRMES